MQIVKMSDIGVTITVDQDETGFTVRAYTRDESEPAPLVSLFETKFDTLSEAVKRVTLFWVGEWESVATSTLSVYELIQAKVIAE
jgi:hypothetical protein